MTPVQVMGDHELAKVIAGYLHTCGLTTAGEAYCWGNNRYGATGLGVSEGGTYIPTPVLGGHRFADLVAGGGVCNGWEPALVEVVVGVGVTCGFTADRKVYCVRPNTAHRPLVTDLPVASLAVGETQTCIVTTDGDTYCWGWNGSGELGTGEGSPGWFVRRGVWAPSGG
jgi:alpha-tubulin suppressor-like RCC1 family protein